MPTETVYSYYYTSIKTTNTATLLVSFLDNSGSKYEVLYNSNLIFLLIFK